MWFADWARRSSSWRWSRSSCSRCCIFTPGDPAAILAGDAATDDDIRRIRDKLGLDQPFFVRFGGWVWALLHGDLGTSIFTNLPVTHLIGSASSRRLR